MDSMSRQKLNEVLAKPLEMLDEYDLVILRARRSYLSAVEAAKYAGILGESQSAAKMVEEVGEPPVGTGKAPVEIEEEVKEVKKEAKAKKKNKKK